MQKGAESLGKMKKNGYSEEKKVVCSLNLSLFARINFLAVTHYFKNKKCSINGTKFIARHNALAITNQFLYKKK